MECIGTDKRIAWERIWTQLSRPSSSSNDLAGAAAHRPVAETLTKFIGALHYLDWASTALRAAVLPFSVDPMVHLIYNSHDMDVETVYSLKTGMTFETTVDSFGIQRHDFCIARCEGHLYMFGGSAGEGSREGPILSDNALKYDLATASCARMPDMPTARRGATAVVVASSIYVIGGRDLRIHSAAVEKFDTLTEHWTSLPNLRHNRLFCAAVALETSIYVFGGCLSLEIERLNTLVPGASEVLAVQMPIHISLGCAAIAVERQRQIFVFGGWNRPPLPDVGNLAHVLDLDLEMWTRLPDMPAKHEYFCQAVDLDGSLYLFGGTKTGAVSKYEPWGESSMWKVLPGTWRNSNDEGCYLAYLVEPHQVRIYPDDPAGDAAQSVIEEVQHDGPGQQVDPEDAAQSVIEEVQHDEPGQQVDPEVAADIVAVQESDFVQRNLDAAALDDSSTASAEDPEEDMIYLLAFNRNPKQFHTALLEGIPLRACRRALKEHDYDFMLPSGAKVVVHPHQYITTKKALVGLELFRFHVIVASSLEYLVQESLLNIPRGEGVYVRKRAFLSSGPRSGVASDSGAASATNVDPDDIGMEPMPGTFADANEPTLSEMFLDVTRRFICHVAPPLANASSVTQSTTEAHNVTQSLSHSGVNPRRVSASDL